MNTAASHLRGFADPVHDSQRVFRCVMNALARPASIHPLVHGLDPCNSLKAGAAAVLLTLADYDTPLWLDPLLAADDTIRSFIAFQTAARIVREPSHALLAVASSAAMLPPLREFAQGSPDYPDRSTTVVLQADRLSDQGHSFTGPGIRTRQNFGFAPQPEDFVVQWVLNRRRFPLGVDLLIIADDQIAGLPRSAMIGDS